jgi:uncharacterized membrane protein YphA (DoxX/SURF4 family)
MPFRNVPTRLATGAYILHSGLEKWAAEEEQAKALHARAADAFPLLGDLAPAQFVRRLALAEIALGAALLLPFVGNKLAGLALAGFSGSLLTMYWRTPSMHKPGSIWPTPQGMGLSKDVWMLGIALGLLAD